jgi:ATP-dependent Clp protease ATP-binding subunit ClpA
MFERFTDRARRAIVVAQQETRDLAHGFIRPEHLLLGLMDGDGLAATALRQCGLDADSMRQRVVDAVVPAASARHLDKVPFSGPAKKTLENSLREALRLGHNYIGTEHILLGLLRGADDTFKRVLGTDVDHVKMCITALIPTGFVGSASLRSPAVTAAMDRARHVAGDAPMTTGHLVRAVLADGKCEAATALAELGVTEEAFAAALEHVVVADTTDAPPAPRSVEIRIGDVHTKVDDPALAAALGGLSAEEIRAALARGLLDGGGEARPA